MNVLIGILYCIENEYEECLRSLEQQTHGEHERFVLRDQPRESADDAVYERFMSKAGEFDVFLKLDADMVLEEPTVIERIVHAFREKPWIEMLTFRVYDHFTGHLTPSVNAYRNTVRWTKGHDGLFTDPCPVDDKSRIAQCSELDGSVSHCRNPSAFQAFHFGLHRAMKVVHGDLAGNWNRVALQAVVLERLGRNYRQRGDRPLALAALGAELALAGTFERRHVSYGEPFAADVCREYADWNDARLRKELVRLRRANWGWLPWWMRLGLVNSGGAKAWIPIAKRMGRKASHVASNSLSRVKSARS